MPFTVLLCGQARAFVLAVLPSHKKCDSQMVCACVRVMSQPYVLAESLRIGSEQLLFVFFFFSSPFPDSHCLSLFSHILLFLFLNRFLPFPPHSNSLLVHPLKLCHAWVCGLQLSPVNANNLDEYNHRVCVHTKMPQAHDCRDQQPHPIELDVTNDVREDRDLEAALLSELYHDKIRLLRACLARRDLPPSTTPTVRPVMPLSPALSSSSSSASSALSRVRLAAADDVPRRTARTTPQLPLQACSDRTTCQPWQRHTDVEAPRAKNPPVSEPVTHSSVAPSCSPRDQSRQGSTEPAPTEAKSPSPAPEQKLSEAHDEDRVFIQHRCQRRPWRDASFVSCPSAIPQEAPASSLSHTQQSNGRLSAATGERAARTIRITAITAPTKFKTPSSHRVSATPRAASDLTRGSLVSPIDKDESRKRTCVAGDVREPRAQLGRSDTHVTCCSVVSTPTQRRQPQQKGVGLHKQEIAQGRVVMTDAQAERLSRMYRTSPQPPATHAATNTIAARRTNAQTDAPTSASEQLSRRASGRTHTGSSSSSYMVVTVSAPPVRAAAPAPRQESDNRTAAIRGAAALSPSPSSSCSDARSHMYGMAAIATSASDLSAEEVLLDVSSSSSTASPPLRGQANHAEDDQRRPSQSVLTSRCPNVIRVVSKPGSGGIDMRQVFASTPP